MSKLELRYMVVPEELQEKAIVLDGIKIEILNSEEMTEMGILGESGRKLAEAGVAFYFEREEAMKLINSGLAKELK